MRPRPPTSYESLLMEDLKKARIEHNLNRRTKVHLTPKVFVVKSFGIWPYDRESPPPSSPWYRLGQPALRLP